MILIITQQTDLSVNGTTKQLLIIKEFGGYPELFLFAIP